MFGKIISALKTKDVEKQNNRLPDGRQIKALEGTFNQKQMFTLHKSGLYVPESETIMSVIEHDQSIHSGAYNTVNDNHWWRTGEYAFYPRDFEKEDIPLGEQLIYIEDGVSHILNIPDEEVKLPNGEIIGLRQATGMGVIRLEKLELKPIDENKDEVSVTTDFDPRTDVKVVDVMRPRDWALVDASGIPLRSKPSNSEVQEARYSWIRHSDDFNEESTGYHGSLARDGGWRRYVYAGTVWSYVSGVALVSRPAVAPREVDILNPIGESAYRTGMYSSATVQIPDSVIQAAKAEYASLPEHTKMKLKALGQLLDSLAIKE